MVVLKLALAPFLGMTMTGVLRCRLSCLRLVLSVLMLGMVLGPVPFLWKAVQGVGTVLGRRFPLQLVLCRLRRTGRIVRFSVVSLAGAISGVKAVVNVLALKSVVV